jgi:GTP-binding protein
MEAVTEQSVPSAPDAKRESLPLVAIVGRPNVGKSTLFNRLIGQRRAITGDEPGITRDRIYGEAEWLGERFSVVDTGGIVPDDEAVIPANILKQAGFAIAEAAALVWVVDVRQGITPLDEELAALLRSTGKPVLIAANKTEAARLEREAAEFYKFGFDEVFPISAEQGIGFGEMLDVLVEIVKKQTTEAAGEVHHVYGTTIESDDASEAGETPAVPVEARAIRLAIIGRPNVGKSSLLNKLLGKERAIVSAIPGTTRDAVDTLLETPGQAFQLIDTAGIRRKGKTDQMTEKLAVVMARKSMERADVALVMIDAEEGVTALDANIAGYAHDAGCSILIIVNKWDALQDKKTGTPAEFERGLRERMKFLDWAPVITISALTGQRVDKILALAVRANEARNLRISTSRLNQFFERAISQPQGGGAPAPVKGGVTRLHVQYLTQIGVRPPTFVLFTAGGKAGLHFSYERYVYNQLREEFDFFATPLRIIERHRKDRRKKK